jgi:hypothetical protein
MSKVAKSNIRMHSGAMVVMVPKEIWGDSTTPFSHAKIAKLQKNNVHGKYASFPVKLRILEADEKPGKRGIFVEV